MKRTRKVAVVAHCLLNANTKVHGIAKYPSLHPAALALLEGGHAFVQLPCPEVTYLGMRRWGMTRDQYDTPGYRRHCREALRASIDTIEALVGDGCEITLLGADGSPSCGVNRTCEGWEGCELGPDARIPEPVDVVGRGVLIEELAILLAERGLEVPLHGTDE